MLDSVVAVHAVGVAVVVGGVACDARLDPDIGVEPVGTKIHKVFVHACIVPEGCDNLVRSVRRRTKGSTTPMADRIDARSLDREHERLRASRTGTRRTVAIVDAFPKGPILSPTAVNSIAEFADIFGHDALEDIATLGLQRWFDVGGESAIIVRCAGPQPLQPAQLVSGISVLANLNDNWDFLCLTALSRFDDFEFVVIASHAQRVCDELGRYAEIYDPRNLLVAEHG